MDLLDKTEAHRQTLKTFDSVIHSLNVIDHLRHFVQVFKLVPCVPYKGMVDARLKESFAGTTIILDVLSTFAYTPPSVCPVRPAFATDKENQQWDHTDKIYRWEDGS